jgi:hypothetical protein
MIKKMLGAFTQPFSQSRFMILKRLPLVTKQITACGQRGGRVCWEM